MPPGNSVPCGSSTLVLIVVMCVPLDLAGGSWWDGGHKRLWIWDEMVRVLWGGEAQGN